MKTASFLVYALALSLLHSAHAQQCEKSIAIHQIVKSPKQIYKLWDGRELKASIYNVGNCTGYTSFATGQISRNNLTSVGQDSPVGTSTCLIKSIPGSDPVYDSMQAIVIRSKGWKFGVKSIDLEDIDSQSGIYPENAWKESMAIFGEADGKLILPTVNLYRNTMLTSKHYKIPAAARSEMELEGQDIRVLGAEFSAPALHNCGTGADGQGGDASLCRMTAKFSTAVDTLVILYALTQKSVDDSNSFAFVSSISVDCSCRCSKQNKVMPILQPVPGKTNECVRSEGARDGWYCDFMGDFVCSREAKPIYKSRDELPNGHVECYKQTADVTIVQSPYLPVETSASSIGPNLN